MLGKSGVVLLVLGALTVSIEALAGDGLPGQPGRPGGSGDLLGIGAGQPGRPGLSGGLDSGAGRPGRPGGSDLSSAAGRPGLPGSSDYEYPDYADDYFEEFRSMKPAQSHASIFKVLKACSSVPDLEAPKPGKGNWLSFLLKLSESGHRDCAEALASRHTSNGTHPHPKKIKV